VADHVCPWWIGYFLLSPLRKLIEDPKENLGPHVREKMTVLDFGCAMGFFTLPLAELVGPEGKVVALDLQERMIATLQRRARKAGLESRIETVVAASAGELNRPGEFDFILTAHVIHEVPDQRILFQELFDLLRPGGRLLAIEPKGHVSAADFDESLKLAEDAGFAVIDRSTPKRGRLALLERPA